MQYWIVSSIDFPPHLTYSFLITKIKLTGPIGYEVVFYNENQGKLIQSVI